MPELEWIKARIEWLDALKMLTDAEKGRLFSAILEYAKTGKEPKLSGNERFIFVSIKQQLDHDAEIREIRIEAGKASGSARREKMNKPEQNRTKTNKIEQTRTGESFVPKSSKSSKSDRVEENKSVRVVEGKSDRVVEPAAAGITTTTTPPPPTPTTFESPPPLTTDFSEMTRDTLDRWYAHRKSQGYTFHDPAKRELEAEVRENVSKYGEAAVAEVVDYSISRGYKTLFWDRLEKGKTSVTHIDPDGKKRSGEAQDYEIQHRAEIQKSEKELEKLLAGLDSDGDKA